jgi:hypothetical protein
MEKETAAVAAETPRPFLLQYFTRMPIVFPLVGLFLLGMAGFEAWNYLGDDEVSRIYWLRPAVLFLYFLFWSGACFRLKKPGLAFLVLTMVNVAFHLFGPDILLKRALGDILFIPLPVNILFSFLLLFYFRRLQ